MYPELFKIGNFPIFSYGVLLVIAFFVGVLLMRMRAPRYGIAPDKVWDAGFWALICGVLGARIAYILTELPTYLANPSLFLHWRFDGLTSYGGIIGGSIAVMVWCRVNKIPTMKILDVAAAPFLVSHAIGRIGCLLNGCCYGGHCDLPWGIHVQGAQGLFHPAQIYDSLFNIAGFVILILWERKTLKTGQSFGIMLMLHGVARVIYELWRRGETSAYLFGSFITIAQSVSILIAVVGLIIFLVAEKRGQTVAQEKA
jgi:phosphatidylglycerol:prolipoprotein diacylglycerol transferase